MSIGEAVALISIFLIIGFLVLIIFFLRQAKKLKLPPPPKEEGIKEALADFQENWQGVLAHMKTSSESDWKLAVIEADKIVDKILILKGYKGESMAERMISIDNQELKSLDLLWEAHKVRNRIAHKPGFKLDFNQAKKIISYYEEVLKDLRAIGG